MSDITASSMVKGKKPMKHHPRGHGNMRPYIHIKLNGKPELVKIDRLEGSRLINAGKATPVKRSVVKEGLIVKRTATRAKETSKRRE